MFILEIIIILLSVSILGIMMRNREVKTHYLLSLLGLTWLLIITLSLLGIIHWQLYLLYVPIFMLSLLFYFKEVKQKPIKPIANIIISSVSIVFILVSVTAYVVFPVYDIPTPNGAYSIGTESFTIEDETRLERYSDNDTDIRKINIQLWYPAETTEGFESAFWLNEGKAIARGLSKDMGFPFFTLDHTASIPSNAYINAPISEDKTTYPVVIISHGWRGFKNLHTDYAEELASQGYIVVAIDHTYGSVATVFDDDVIYVNKDALPDRETTPDFLDYANQLVSTYAADITTTIDYLEILNDNTTSRFNNKLDLSTLGLIGHSTGGGASVSVGLNDSRIDAIIGLDAWVEPINETELSTGLTIPTLFLRSETWEVGPNNIDLYTLIENSHTSTKLYQIDGTTHYDFAMVYMYSPLTKYIGFSGELEADYLNTMLKSMIVNFFDATLINDEVDNIDIGSWEEVNEVNRD